MEVITLKQFRAIKEAFKPPFVYSIQYRQNKGITKPKTQSHV
ncbi:MAG: hypothetical protein ACI8Q1_000252 [Parvicella sp.]|jgi:hypothetical protein